MLESVCPYSSPLLSPGPKFDFLPGLRFTGHLHVNGLCANLPVLQGTVLQNHILSWTQACLERQRQASGLQNLFPVDSVTPNGPVYNKLTPLVCIFFLK